MKILTDPTPFREQGAWLSSWDDFEERRIKSFDGFWFAATLPDMEIWADNHPDLIPLASLDFVINKDMAKGWYVPRTTKNPSDLLKGFSHWALNKFGIYTENLNWQI